jgi:hypothetical protein
MLWNTYPEVLDNLTLAAAYQTLEGIHPNEIPWIVWLLENPTSPCALPGSIDLFGHDCIHLLLKQGFTVTNEAYVLGFTMGNDSSTTWLHLWFFKIAACILYPSTYRMNLKELAVFDQGYNLGYNAKIKNINQINFIELKDETICDIRLKMDLENTDPNSN